ncbi:MAG TPA: efflux RND transporter periplasmic adaptor subunit [Candidatus Saccharimonadales bacterium]|nr:efflux RND transporter periplasmic adaptor subunit [Candidatus Saccharimonadales bacterium]
MKIPEYNRTQVMEEAPKIGRPEQDDFSAQPPRKIGWMLLLLLIVVIVALAAGLIPRWRQRHNLIAESKELGVTTVTVVSSAPGQSITGTFLPAEVRPLTEASIYARASGYLKKWYVDIGAKVTQGQLLAEVDTPELNQELERARAELRQSEAALALSKTTATRWAELLKTASVSEQEAAEKQADLALKSATLGASQANVERLRELQSFSKVTAPFAGVITARLTDVGQLIKTDNVRELFRLAEVDKLRVYVRAPQAEARAIRIGQAAELTIPEIHGKTFKAKVVRTAGAMNPETRTLLTELEVDNTTGEILAGSYAELKLTDTRTDVPLTVPSNTLLFRSEGAFVGVVSQDNKIDLRSVTLGRDFGKRVEVLSGIEAKDRLVLNPPDSIVSGMAVRIAEEAQAKP